MLVSGGGGVYLGVVGEEDIEIHRTGIEIHKAGIEIHKAVIGIHRPGGELGE